MDPPTNGVSNHSEIKTNQRGKRKKSAKSPNKNKQQFQFGNYQNYYYKRLGAGEQQTDFRLELLKAHPEFFRGKKVLDIGCNSGFITINFAKQFQPSAVLGIDIDGSLVDKARSELEKEKTGGELPQKMKEALNRVIFRKVFEFLPKFFEDFLEFSTFPIHRRITSFRMKTS
jgi:2-polyprenyl-3-methyl-5-hydroxy-6-metoxy-1,4-benzoquinol methylase